jgi:hypothetical protein
VETFKKEVLALKTHFDFLASIFKSQGLPVDSVNFVGLQTFEKQTVDNANFTELYFDAFNAQFSTQQRENHQANFSYKPEEIEFTVKMSLSITILKKSTGTRTRFYDGAVSIQG